MDGKFFLCSWREELELERWVGTLEKRSDRDFNV